MDPIAPGSTATSNKVAAPKKGDVIHLLVKPFGGVQRLKEEADFSKFAEDGDHVIAVEVTSSKLASVTLS